MKRASIKLRFLPRVAVPIVCCTVQTRPGGRRKIFLFTGPLSLTFCRNGTITKMKTKPIWTAAPARIRE